MIVTDTNLLVYLYVRGQRTAQAEAVLVRDPAWAAPLLWRSEFRNTLGGLVRRRDIDLDDAVRMAHDAERRMGGAEFSVASQLVLQLAIRSRCSAYDCEFVALAQDLTDSLRHRRPGGPCRLPVDGGLAHRLRRAETGADGRRRRSSPPAPRRELADYRVGRIFRIGSRFFGSGLSLPTPWLRTAATTASLTGVLMPFRRPWSQT